MKTHLITLAFITGATLLSAQENNKATTVRIKKIESINGKETVKDTTYTVNGPLNINTLEPGIPIKEKHITIFTDQVSGDAPSLHETVDEKNMTAMIDEQVAKALRGLGMDSSIVEKTFTFNTDAIVDKQMKEQSVRVVIVKRSNLMDATDEEKKRVCKKAGPVNNQLAVDDLEFSKETVDSRANLSFHLAGRGNTNVTVLNSEGQIIYNEQLNNFTGDYSKDVDLSQYAKGIYFIRLEQGGQGVVKKVILE